MTTNFNKILQNVTGDIQYKIFSKLTEKAGIDVFLDFLSKGNQQIIIYTPTDKAFTQLPKNKFTEIANFTTLQLIKFINSHIMIHAIPIPQADYMLVYNIAGQKYVATDEKIKSVKLTGVDGLHIGKIAIVPIDGILE